MRRRVIAAIAATLLALVAVGLVATYVAGADQRAMAQYDPTSVLVVKSDIPVGGSPVVGENVELRDLPAVAVLPGSLTEIDTLKDLVAAVPLVPGDQVIPQRFVTREALTGDMVEVPAELVQVTVLLEPQRILGGKLTAGDSVGIVMSTGEGGIGTSETILHRTLVSRIQADAETTNQDDNADEATPAPGSQFITLAVSAADAERVVWGSEHGTLWLTLERETSVITGTDTVVRIDDFAAGSAES